jgi:hypothetical protein
MMNVGNSRVREAPQGLKPSSSLAAQSQRLKRCAPPNLCSTQDQSFAQDHSFVACGLWEVLR